MEIDNSGLDDHGRARISERDNSNVLCYDELFSICKRLSACDRLSFRAVSKSWLAAHKGWIRGQPWTVTFVNSPGVRKLAITDPSSSILPWTKIVTDEERILNGAHIVASKGRWFLLLNRWQELFCFTPFKSSPVIKLPSCASWASSCTSRACFTDEPTSPGCVILLVKVDPSRRTCVDVMTCRPGAETCEARVLGAEFGDNNMVEECKDVVYGDGKFYLVFRDGNVGQFSIVDKVWTQWSVLPVRFPESIRPTCLDLSMHLVCHEEELWMVCANDCEMPFDLFRLDREKMVWVRKQDLGGGVIFVNKGCSSIFYRGSWVGESFANKIVFCPRDYTWFYCLETRRHEIIESYPVMAKQGKIWIEPFF